MLSTELPHLLFRWIHVLAAVMWIGTRPGEPSSTALVGDAALRLRHNAALAVAVILFMVSNHFPLVYGRASEWLLAPGIVVLGCFVSWRKDVV